MRKVFRVVFLKIWRGINTSWVKWATMHSFCETCNLKIMIEQPTYQSFPMTKNCIKIKKSTFFFRSDLKAPCIKNSEYQSQTKKNDSICNFCDFSLLVSYPNKFLVVCIYILIFHGIYSPYPQILFLWGTNFFLCVL